jgi:hypothetical protein
MVLAARSEFGEAERLGGEAVRMYADAECPNAHGDAWMVLAKVLQMSGNATEAGQAARQALVLFERKGNRPSSAAAQAFIEELAR